MPRRAPRRPLLAAVATALVLVLLLVPVHATAADQDRQSHPEKAERSSGWAIQDPLVLPALPNLFLGSDGDIHRKAGWTVRGLNGTRYLGEEFDSACVTGAQFGTELDEIARFAQTIRQSGRRVIFTVTPSKAAVNKRDLPAVTPHGSCDKQGIAAQDRILDSYSDPSYLPIRRTLARLTAREKPMYWKLDSHWTTVGATVWAQTLAKRLDPAIAKVQRYKKSERTHVPDIAYVVGRTDIEETEEARLTKTKVRTTFEAPGYRYDTLTGYDISWTNKPDKKTWPGRTLLLGDSFTYLGMESLVPLFRQARYMWLGHVSNVDIVQAVAESDTVVIEVAQRYVANSWIADPLTGTLLGVALAASDLRSAR